MFGKANANLEILAVEYHIIEPSFSQSELKYDARVPHDTNSINVFAVAESMNARAKVSGGDNLQEGNNKVEVIVTAEDGITTKTYTLNVYKMNEEEEKKEQEDEEKNKKEAEKLITEKETQRLSTTSGVDNNKEKNSEYIMIIILSSIVVVLIGYILIRKFVMKK